MNEEKLSMAYKIKRSIVATSLLALGVSFEMLSKRAKDLQAEIADWEEGRVFALGVLPNGPAVTMKKEDGQIRYLGKGIKENPKLIIYFKNVENALLPFSGQMGSHTAFIQHRAILHGNVGDAMQVSRAMAIVQTYLMPGLMFGKIFKKPPKMSAAQLLTKARLMATLTILLALNAGK